MSSRDGLPGESRVIPAAVPLAASQLTGVPRAGLAGSAARTASAAGSPADPVTTPSDAGFPPLVGISHAAHSSSPKNPAGG